MATDSFLCSTAGGVVTITLNRPDVLNSFNSGMSAGLVAALAAVAKDDAVRAIVLTGAGRAFCAGQDLAEAMPKDGALPDLGNFVRTSWNPVVLAIRTIEKPVVCAVNGTAAGAGANLALACDIVFASSDASFIQSFAKIGVIPDSGGTFILPRLVGLQRAAALTMLCEKVSATQALEWGMVYKVCEPQALLGDAQATAAHLATQPTRAFGLIKRGFNRSLGVDLAAQLNYEEELQREAGKTADYAEGVKAFLEKRKPVFTGR
ncbi:MAG TPA: enoyl-CoA hydratase-related protein [Gemmatimonadaceae bacterium]|jgi:2-(1,2-epoxy-1,2-dihydrophenyl)acetyl-CoA isomerase